MNDAEQTTPTRPDYWSRQRRALDELQERHRQRLKEAKVFDEVHARLRFVRDAGLTPRAHDLATVEQHIEGDAERVTRAAQALAAAKQIGNPEQIEAWRKVLRTALVELAAGCVDIAERVEDL